MNLNRTNIWSALDFMAKFGYRTTLFNSFPLAPHRILFGTSGAPKVVLDSPLWKSLTRRARP